MHLREHLREIRRRATISAVAVILAGIAGFSVSDFIIDAAPSPLDRLDNVSAALNFTTISGAFDLRFKVAMTVGVVAAAPVWLYQLWAFLVPGLTAKERRTGLGFVAIAVPLFFAGASFGWWIMPNIVLLLVGFAPDGSATLLTANEYFDFLLRLVVAVGVGFVAPLVLVALNAVGVLRASTILKAWRGAIVVIVVFSAMVTPSADVLSMFILAVPLIALYFGSYAWAAIHDRRSDRAQARMLAAAM